MAEPDHQHMVRPAPPRAGGPRRRSCRTRRAAVASAAAALGRGVAVPRSPLATGPGDLHTSVALAARSARLTWKRLRAGGGHARAGDLCYLPPLVLHRCRFLWRRLRPDGAAGRLSRQTPAAQAVAKWLRRRILASQQGPPLERLAWVVNFGILCLLVVEAIELTRSLVGDRGAAEPARGSAHAQVGGRSATPGRDLGRLSIFGRSEADAPTALDSAPPDTTLDLQLKGLVSSESPARARAIIAAPHGVELPYPVGARLPGDATLKQIFADHVVLVHQGRYETLRMRWEEAEPDESAAARAVVPPAGTRGPNAQLQPYWKVLGGVPGRLTRIVTFEPVMQDGRFLGYRLGRGRMRGVLATWQLQDGDVLVEVNGIALDTPRHSTEALQAFATAESVSAKVIRAGVMESVQVSGPSWSGGASE